VHEDRHARAWCIWRYRVYSVVATCPHTPRKPKRVVGQLVFYWPGSVLRRDLAAVEGYPWPGRPRAWAPLGGRFPGLHLAAAVLPSWRRRNIIAARSCVNGRLLPLLRRSSRTRRGLLVPLTPAPSDWASPRKKEEQNLQRPAAYRPGERSASFSPPPLRRPWAAQPPLRVAAAHSPQKKPSGQDCFVFFFQTTLQPP
jgi:hypothetical protein